MPAGPVTIRSNNNPACHTGGAAMKRIFPTWMGLAVFAMGVTAAPGALAQEAFPSKPVILILPQDAAGLETEMRQFTQNILEHSQVRMVVDKRPGAAGTIASAYVAKAAPDGYTTLVQNSGYAITPF